VIVVVTTCPRDGASYLDETLRSLGGGAIVFDDIERKGARWNTWRALACGSRERLLLVQDDVIADPSLVDIARLMHIPGDVGVVSFHDCGDDFHWQTPPPGVHKFPAHRLGSHGLIGAQCLLFPPDQARWLSEQDMDAPPWPGPHAADTAIGWWTRRSPRPNKLVVTPALVRHVGEESACWPDRKAAGAPIPHAGRTLEDMFGENLRHA
jgi:hypothetical protein